EWTKPTATAALTWSQYWTLCHATRAICRPAGSVPPGPGYAYGATITWSWPASAAFSLSTSGPVAPGASQTSAAPCSSEWIAIPMFGGLEYTPAWSGVGLCGPDAGGCDG